MEEDSFRINIKNSKINSAIDKNKDENLPHFYLGSNVKISKGNIEQDKMIIEGKNRENDSKID